MTLLNQESTPMNCLAANDVGGFREALHIEEGRRFADTNEFFHWLITQDMRRMLGVPSRCRCFFHEDRQPSASLYMHNGQSLYNCHAGCTEKPLSIIGLYAKMHHCSNGAAMNALVRFFDADIENPGPFIPAGEVAFLNKNRELLRHMPEKAPGAYALLKTELEVLYMLMNCTAEKAMAFEGGVQISASGRFINSRLSHKVRPSCTLAMLSYFGLLRRLRLDEIPPRQLEQLECFSEQQYRRCLERGFDEEAEVYHRCKRRLISQTVLFPYHAPDFYGRLEERAEHWKALGYTKRSFSYREIALRENPFLALDCFPQTENRDKTKEVSDDGVTL